MHHAGVAKRVGGPPQRLRHNPPSCKSCPPVQNFSSFSLPPSNFCLHPSNKCAQIAKEWLDKGLAKCHEIAVPYPSSRNPPAWIGKINGISFFTPTGTPPSSSAPETPRIPNSIHHSPSKIQNFLIPSVPPVAVFATTLGSGFVEMILHPLPIQQFIKIKFKKYNN